jgi:hypothetical protein
MNKKKNESKIYKLKKYILRGKKKIKFSQSSSTLNIFSKTFYKTPSHTSGKIVNNESTTTTNINNNFFSFSPKRIKRNKTVIIKFHTDKKNKKKFLLSKEERIKLNHIIKKFKKNKNTTNGLFEKEKRIPLNSVNKSNFMFLLDDEEKEKKQKKRKNQKISKKTLKFLKYTKSGDILLTSSMMNQFNNKTASILDLSLPKSIKFSKNIFSFSHIF